MGSSPSPGSKMTECIYCTKLLKLKRSKFCSAQCQQDHNWLLKKLNFEQTGLWDGVISETVITRHCKRYLKEVRGIQCEICGTITWMGKEVPLVLDHIDGHASNSSLSNLRLVCGNCDMQLPTYKKKNVGKGRHSRKIRYQEGKSS